MVDRKQLVEQYIKWILMHESDDYKLSQNDSGNIELLTEKYLGRVNFYPEEIMELRIDRLEDDATLFFLHFQMNTVEHAHLMFEELEKALVAMNAENHVEILLSCTGGLTTSYFASALNEAAESMHLNYHFSAISVETIKENGFGYDAVLLAPQISFMRNEIQEALKDAVIINIPPTIFGGYDAPKLIELLQKELEVSKEQKTPNSVRMSQYFKTSEDILTFICLDQKISYRYYEHGVVKAENICSVEKIDEDNILKTIEETLQQYPNTTMINVALEGKVNHGVLNGVDFKTIITEKFKKRTLVYNDANMCVTGLYWLKDHYRSLIYLRKNEKTTEAGVMINGHLVRGKGYFAGELKHIQRFIEKEDESESMKIAKLLTTMQATIGVEAIFIDSDLIQDVNEVKKDMEAFVDAESMPDLILMDEVKEYLFTGLFLRSVWNKEHSTRKNNGLLKYKQ